MNVCMCMFMHAHAHRYTPHYFNMDKKTGAPPDDYAEMGRDYVQ